MTNDTTFPPLQTPPTPQLELVERTDAIEREIQRRAHADLPSWSVDHRQRRSRQRELLNSVRTTLSVQAGLRGNELFKAMMQARRHVASRLDWEFQAGRPKHVYWLTDDNRNLIQAYEDDIEMRVRAIFERHNLAISPDGLDEMQYRWAIEAPTELERSAYLRSLLSHAFAIERTRERTWALSVLIRCEPEFSLYVPSLDSKTTIPDVLAFRDDVVRYFKDEAPVKLSQTAENLALELVRTRRLRLNAPKYRSPKLMRDLRNERSRLRASGHGQQWRETLSNIRRRADQKLHAEGLKAAGRPASAYWVEAVRATSRTKAAKYGSEFLRLLLIEAAKWNEALSTLSSRDRSDVEDAAKGLPVPDIAPEARILFERRPPLELLGQGLADISAESLRADVASRCHNDDPLPGASGDWVLARGRYLTIALAIEAAVLRLYPPAKSRNPARNL